MPHAQRPATQDWPLAQLVPHAPQFSSSSEVLRQLPPQQVVPVLHDLPSVLAPPQLTHAPATHTSSVFGQSLETVHAHTPLVQALPAAHGEQSSVPPGHDSSRSPHAHAPLSHVAPVPHAVPHAPQCASLVVLSTQPPPQHESPLAHAPPEVPAAPHA